MTGTIHPKKTMFLRQDCGKAKGDKVEYELTAAMTGEPIVRSSLTGKFFTLSWENIIDLAIEAGIDKEDSK
jgi:hypothetical protein